MAENDSKNAAGMQPHAADAAAHHAGTTLVGNNNPVPASWDVGRDYWQPADPFETYHAMNTMNTITFVPPPNPPFPHLALLPNTFEMGVPPPQVAQASLLDQTPRSYGGAPGVDPEPPRSPEPESEPPRSPGGTPPSHDWFAHW